MVGIITSPERISSGDEHVRDLSFIGCEVDAYLGKLIGRKFQDYRRRWAAAEQRLQTPEFPLFLEVETVDACNLRCKMCFRRLQQPGPSRRMDSDLFQRIIDQVRLGKCPSMCLNGNNEPLLDPLLPDRIAMAHDAGVLDTRINTNGMLLSEDLSTRLIESGLTRLSVSIDAARPETYAGIREGGNFARVLKNVSRFLKIRQKMGVRLPLLRVTFVVLRENQTEMDEFIRYWGDRADYVSFQRYVPHTQDQGVLNMGGDVDSHPGSNPCSQPFERLVVDTYGNIFPCCSPLGRRLLLGSLRDHTLQDIWHSTRETRLRRCLSSQKWSEEPICAVCRGRTDSDDQATAEARTVP